MTGEEIEQLKSLLTSAVEAAYAEPSLLLESNSGPRKGNEQSVAFRVGIHLYEILKGTQFAALHLDCEYNKHGDDPKKLDELAIRPDLLIHRRGDDDHNVLAVEFGGWWKKPAKVESDRDKLRKLTSQDFAYKYQLGVLVNLNPDDATYEYFRNGTT